MTIEIVLAERTTDDETGDYWSVLLEITNVATAYALPTTAPGTLAASELQAHFEAQETTLWRVAQAKRYPVDVWERVPLKRLLKAFALVILDEINILRMRAGLAQRTPAQIVTAIKVKLRQ